MSGSWQQRVRHAPGPHQLHAAQNAGRNLVEQAGHLLPGKARLVFQTVIDVALLGTVVVSGALAAVHLWKALVPGHKEMHPPEPAGSGRSPPRHPVTITASPAGARGHGIYEDDGISSR